MSVSDPVTYVTFAHANVGYVLDGLEDATVRYQFERADRIDAGDRIELRTPSGKTFAIAEVVDIWTCPLRLAYHDTVVVDDRNHPADDALDLFERMKTHYGDDHPDYDDEVTVIYFDVLDVVAQVDIETQGGIVTKRLGPGDTLERSNLTITGLPGDADA